MPSRLRTAHPVRLVGLVVLWTMTGCVGHLGGGDEDAGPLPRVDAEPGGSDADPARPDADLTRPDADPARPDSAWSIDAGPVSDAPPQNFDPPSWYVNAPDNTWIELGHNTMDDVNPCPDVSCPAGSHDHIMTSWNGAIARENYLSIVAQGGHQGSADNGVYEFGPFTSETPMWVRSRDPSDLDFSPGGPNYNVRYYSDGTPAARHGYNHQAFIPPLGNGAGNRWFAPWAYVTYGNSNGAGKEVASFHFTSPSTTGGHYDPAHTYPDFPGGGISSGSGFAVWDAATEKVWTVNPAYARQLYSFDPRTGSWAGPFSDHVSWGIYTSPALDLQHRIIVVHQRYGSTSNLYVFDLDQNHLGDWVHPSHYTGSLVTGQQLGIEYEPVGRKIVSWDGGRSIHILNVPSNYRNTDGTLNANATWNWTERPAASGGATPTPRNQNGTYGRFRYIPSIRALAVVNNTTESVYVYKIPATGL